MGAVVFPAACVRGSFKGSRPVRMRREYGSAAVKMHGVAVARRWSLLNAQGRQLRGQEGWRPDPHPFPRHKAIHVSAGLPLQAAIHGDGARYLREQMQHLARPIFWLPLRNPHSRLPAQAPAKSPLDIW